MRQAMLIFYEKIMWIKKKKAIMMKAKTRILMTGNFMAIFNFVIKRIKLLLKFARLILFIYN